MTRVLVTYATMAGSTAEVAQAVTDELERAGLAVDVRPMADVDELTDYDAVVAGGPMIMGWHRQALGFVRRHRRDWQRVPLAVFVLAISLTQPDEPVVDGLPVFVDEQLPKPPAEPGRLSFRERYATLTRYVRPILRAVGPSRPASVGVFGGRLEFGRLKWWAVLFVALVIRASAGDRRNDDAIRAWAAALPGVLVPEAAAADPA